MSAHNGQPPAPPTALQITRRVTFDGVTVNIAKGQNGIREIQIIDPGSGTIYAVALSAEDSRKIGHELITTVPVAQPGDIPEAA